MRWSLCGQILMDFISPANEENSETRNSSGFDFTSFDRFEASNATKPSFNMGIADPERKLMARITFLLKTWPPYSNRAALISSQVNPIHLRASLFHSSPILERRRRTHWDSGRSAYKGSSRKSIFSRRYRKLNSRQALFQSVNGFAEQFFQSWQHDSNEYDPSSSRDSSWFRRDFKVSGHKRGRSRNKGQHQQRGFQFFEEDDIEIENFFRSAFSGNRNYYWSFINEEPQWRKHQYSDYDESTNSDNSESDLSSERLTLGLNAFGPLNLEDVKNAYRVCALKWHPDRHQGSSKVVAEEKFKACSAAYQCLCDNLGLS